MNKIEPTYGNGVSPQGGNRACLCIDKDTYSIKCCEGYLMQQGIGIVSR